MSEYFTTSVYHSHDFKAVAQFLGMMIFTARRYASVCCGMYHSVRLLICLPVTHKSFYENQGGVGVGVFFSRET